MERKRLDMIVANLVGRDKVFQSDHNAVEIYWPGGERSMPEADKQSLARDIVETVVERFDAAVDAETLPEPSIRVVRD